jgi:hypothetical protein
LLVRRGDVDSDTFHPLNPPVRGFIATKGDVPATIKRLEHCLEWRREAGVDDVDRMAKEVESEVSTGA